MRDSILKFDLIANDGDGPWNRTWRGIGGQDLELKRGAGSATDEVDDVGQGKTMHVHEGIIALGKRDDTVAGLELTTELGRSAGKELVDYGIAIFHAKGGADSDRSDGANGGKRGVACGGVRELVFVLQGGVGVF